MKLLGSTKKDVDSDKNSENVPKLESVEVVLVHCNLVKNDYQHTSKALFNFTNLIWFTDQISKALEIKDNVNLTLLLGSYYKNEI